MEVMVSRASSRPTMAAAALTCLAAAVPAPATVTVTSYKITSDLPAFPWYTGRTGRPRRRPPRT